MAELIVPGVRLTRSTEPTWKVEWRGLPGSIVILEDEPWKGSILLANVGNRPIGFDLETRSRGLSITPSNGEIPTGRDVTIQLRLDASSQPGRARLEIRGSMAVPTGKSRPIPSVVIPVEIRERKDKVEFGDALELLEKD